MKKKSESLVLGGLLKKLAPRIGATVTLEPEWKIAGQIMFKNGKKSYFRFNTLDLNPVGASDIAKDKDYAAFFMQRMGYPALRGKTFFSKAWCAALGSKRDTRAALSYAKHKYPLVAKPNSGSHGSGVFLVHNEAELKRALAHIFEHEKVAILQRVVRGRDYRIVVLDDKVISAYERIPLNIVGDGRSSIKQLLSKRQRAFEDAGRDSRIVFSDPRVLHKLKQQRLSLRSVPARNEKVFLLDNANLSSGGDAVDVTTSLHPSYKKLSVRLTRDMGLRLAGVDVMAADITKPATNYSILEINAAPGLDHYVKQGRAQQKIVEDMYLRVLKSLAL